MTPDAVTSRARKLIPNVEKGLVPGLGHLFGLKRPPPHEDLASEPGLDRAGHRQQASAPDGEVSPAGFGKSSLLAVGRIADRLRGAESHAGEVAVRTRRTSIMCMDCGCGVAHGDAEHPDPHLVVEDLKKMAEADETSLSKVLVNINRAAEKDRLEHPDEWA